MASNIIKLGKPSFLTFNLCNDKLFFEMPCLILQTMIQYFGDIQVRKYERF